MRSTFRLALLALSILATGCAMVPQAAQPAYPAWLEMKEGYAQSCIDGGGCVPMTREELQQLVNVVHQRTLEMCRKSSI